MNVLSVEAAPFIKNADIMKNQQSVGNGMKCVKIYVAIIIDAEASRRERGL